MKTKWSEELILRNILTYKDNGVELNSGNIQKINKSLYCAATRKFGSWGKAVKSSGLDYIGRVPNKTDILGDTKLVTVTNRKREEIIVLLDKDVEIHSTIWINSYNYPKIIIDGMHVFLHRHVYGDIKEGNQVDHINRNPLDCRMNNLREVTVSQNNQNRRFKGYHFNTKERKWYAKIKANGKHIHLGTFNNENDASRAYKDARIKYFGEYANN
ncbi:HNH endonuclease [Bacillus toyonensis]|uniref:HNH endonuclease n=1 Tax=Bacillus toyonensis TaxID=155322 RepID=UPI000BEF6A1C|nr:HNH endonuclease [Bacillus toyonensis]PEM64409.1 hypothetical protein CN625_01475 [Bacillus toyonensis]